MHFEDVKKLLEVLHSLVDKGNTIIVIEHNLEVIKTADHIIDMGPEGGENGGKIIAEGSPEILVVKFKDSFTSQYLQDVLRIEEKIIKIESDISDNGDLTDQLKALNELYKSGALTKEEFTKAKKKLLN